MDAPAPALLRPLGVAEIIDRAVTLYIRNVVPLTTIVLVLVFVPFSLGDYFLFQSQTAQFGTLASMLHHPGAIAATSPSINFSDALIGYALLVLAAVLGVFANNAVAVGVAAIYTGRRPSVRASIGTAFRHVGGLLGLIGLGILVLLGAYLVLFLTAFGAVFAVATSAAATSVMRSVPIVVLLVVLLIVLILALLALASLVTLAFTFAGYAVVVEGKGAVSALGSGFERIFRRREWGKAIVILLVALLISAGIVLFSEVAEVLLLFVPGSQPFVALWMGAFSAVSACVQTVFYAVYYYDVRIRREGLDLEVALNRLAPAQP